MNYPIKELLIYYTYDMRGFGKTILSPDAANLKNKPWTWDLLTEDHCNLFLKLKELKPKEIKWILSGHSLGAWISLLAAKNLKFEKLILIDPPILKPNIIIPWSILHLINKRHLSPMSKRVKLRKTQFPSLENAFQELKKSKLMRNWPEENVRDYVEGSFKELKLNNKAILRHNPNWEGHLFEEYPIGAWNGFLKIPKSIRNNIKPIFLVGEDSDTCNPNSQKWIERFFPHLKWIIVPKASHMFPIEMQNETIQLFRTLI